MVPAAELTDVDLFRLAALRVEVRLSHDQGTYRLVRWGGTGARSRGASARIETTAGSRFSVPKRRVRLVAVPEGFERYAP